jgi:hypothetical protein
MVKFSNKFKASERKYRSGFERKTAEDLNRKEAQYGYEAVKVKFVRPAQLCTYTPDWVLWNNGIIIETKGIFDAQDRKKHLLIKEQHPELDIRFVFCNSKDKLYKGSPTTYGSWCQQNGFIYADQLIPNAWLKEPPLPYLDKLKRLGVITYVEPKRNNLKAP